MKWQGRSSAGGFRREYDRSINISADIGQLRGERQGEAGNEYKRSWKSRDEEGKAK